jgi:polyisoprenoid-binding protein YceI
MAKWRLSPEHSVAEFAVRHMMVTWVPGRFNRLTGSLTFDPENVAVAGVEVEIEAASIHTGVEQRDQHLKSADFLEVEKYPKITFKSTRVEAAGLDHAWVHGDLTLRGVTRPVLLDVHWSGPAHFDDEGTVYTTFGFRAKTRINREDFGMVWNSEMEHGGFMVGKHVYITLNAEADLVGEASR